MAGGDHHFRARSLHLVGLYDGRFQTLGRIFRHGHRPSPAGTAKILRAIGIHFPEIGDQKVQELPRFLVESAAPGIIAGIMESIGGLIFFFVNPDPPFPDIAKHSQNRAFDGKGHVFSRPVRSFTPGRAVSMPAFGHYQLFPPQFNDLIVYPLCHCPAQVIVPGEKTEIGHVPSLAGHGPVLPRKIEDAGGIGNRPGIIFHFPGVDGINDIGIQLIDGNPGRGIFKLVFQFVGEPFESFQIVLGQNPHLVSHLPLVFADDGHALRHDPDGNQQPPGHPVERGKIHPHRTIDRAPSAVGAFPEHDVL